MSPCLFAPFLPSKLLSHLAEAEGRLEDVCRLGHSLNLGGGNRGGKVFTCRAGTGLALARSFPLPSLVPRPAPPFTLVPLAETRLVPRSYPSAARLHAAWKTPTKWAPIPIGLGAFYLGVKTVQKRFEGDRADIGMAEDGDEMIVRVRGPWQVRFRF